MTDPIQPLLTPVGAEDAELCGPDGCTIPAGHPANTTTTEEKSNNA